MAQFVDVLLRGVLLVFASVAAGGVAWALLVLRAPADAKPDGPTRLALRATALTAALGAAAQLAVVALVLGDLARHAGIVPLGPYLETGFARVALARVVLGVGLAALAVRLATRPGGRTAWIALAVLAVVFVGSAATMSHAAARVVDRPW